MNPVFKVWFLQSLQKSAGSGGITFLEEMLELLPIESVQQIHAACARIMKKKVPEITVKPSTPHRSSASR